MYRDSVTWVNQFGVGLICRVSRFHGCIQALWMGCTILSECLWRAVILVVL